MTHRYTSVSGIILYEVYSELFIGIVVFPEKVIIISKALLYIIDNYKIYLN